MHFRLKKVFWDNNFDPDYQSSKVTYQSLTNMQARIQIAVKMFS